jgi:hypothetical protein
MSDARFTDLIGRATIDVWGDLPRDVQEAIFEITTRGKPEIRGDLAQYLHDRHPKTAHPPHEGPI